MVADGTIGSGANMSLRRKKGAASSDDRGVLQDMAEISGLQAESSRRLEAGAKVPNDPARKGKGRGDADPVEHREFELLKGLSCTLSAELDLGRLARSILDQARRILGAERGVLFLGKPDAAGLVPLFAVDIHGEELQEIGQVSRTILARAKAGELVVTHDALSDARFSSVKSIQLNQMHSIICGPLVSPSGQVGALYLDATGEHAFLDRAVEFFKALSGIAAVALENARAHGELVREIAEFRVQRPAASPFDRIANAGERMDTLRRQAEVAARLDDPILIVGEVGTGRRRLARAIHDSGRRAGLPFVECDCAAVDPDHFKGALLGRTGPATKGHPHPESGLIRQAEPGSLLLTSAQALDDELAAAIVHLGEQGAFRPMGSRREERANLRLFLTMEEGRSRPSGERRRVGLSRVAQWFRLTVPPLRERSEDVPVLAAQFARAALGPGVDSDMVPYFTSDAIERMTVHSWPGNIRELEHAVRRMLLASPRIPVTAATVEDVLRAGDPGVGPAIGPWSGQIRPLREWEDEAIRQALLRTNGNKTAAARLLGVHRNTIVLRTKAVGTGSEEN